MTASTEYGIDVHAVAQEITSRVRDLERPNTAGIRAIRREFQRRIASAPPRQVVELALTLQGTPGVHRFVGDELIAYHKTAPHTLKKTGLERLGRGMNSWDQVDCFAGYLAGPAWREGRISNAVVHAWARSPDRWWRRAALVSTVALNVKARGGTGDPARTLAVCRLLVGDRDDMVVKAMSWALRALAERDPSSVGRFLTEHRAQLAARVVREVSHKLTTGLKSPRRPPKNG